MTAAARVEQAQQAAQPVAVARRNELLDYITKYGGELEKLTQRDRFTGKPVVDASYYLATLELYFREHPDLLECRPLSIATGMLRVAQTGLVLGVSCDLLPFGKANKVCQFSPRYTGLIELALQSGVRAINTGVVREGDHFEFSKGLVLKLQHDPIAKSTAPILRAYAFAEVKQGSFSVECMTKEQIDAHRRRYSRSWWKEKNGREIPLEEVPWYGKKTCVRQLSSVLPKNPRLAAALMFEKQAEEAVEDDEIPEATYELQEPVRPARVVEEPTPQREPGEEEPDDRELDDFPGRGISGQAARAR
jgi:phage RecT family recombinase